MIALPLILIASGVATIGSGWNEPDRSIYRWQLKRFGGRNGARLFGWGRGTAAIVLGLALLLLAPR